MSEFTVDVYQNEYLTDGAREVNAIATVVSTHGGAVPATARRAEVIVVDTSGSMGYPESKISAARKAVAAAIDSLYDGVEFAVVAGSHTAEMVYPPYSDLATASEHTRRAAKQAVKGLKPDGGTAIGSWLRKAKHLFAGRDDAIKHVILLTDGNNQHETEMQLDAALTACKGTFTCDCRGVGTDWKVAELRKVAAAMLGSVDIIPNPAQLEADFRAMAESSMGKSVGAVTLRLWTPQGAAVRFVKQVMPDVADLTGRRTDVGPQRGDYPLGAWGEESRDYHVCVDVQPGTVGDEMLAARVSLVAADQVLAQGLIRAVWTDDEALSTRINPQVAHYTGQAELAQAIQEGLEARRIGDEDTATARLGRAVQLAAQSGNTAVAELLGKVVDIDDPATGTVRLKSRVSDADEMALDTRSSKTVRVGKKG
ncbi:MAG TPA: VWA domain-containing protein [Streptosporangiaceae bacterium]|jgi:hypothetical protein